MLNPSEKKLKHDIGKISKEFDKVYDDVTIAHAPKQFDNYLYSKASASWGCSNFSIDDLSVAYIILSPWHKGDKRMLLFDFKMV